MRKLMGMALVVFITGCATTAAPPEERAPEDPWEPWNRSVFLFNAGIDRAVVRPVARGYDRVTPSPLKRGVSNFFTNIRSPVVIVNLLLQGQPANAGEELKRFFVNTVYGIGGIFDIASAGDIDKHEADFGHTLATWAGRKADIS